MASQFHNFKIFLKLCNLNLKKLLIYRGSFYISLILMSVWVLSYVTLIEVIFYHTSSLAGWNKGQVLLIMAFYYFIQNIADIFFKDNMEDFGETVRRGELDFKITKPVSTRLLSFFWEMRFDHIAGLFVTTGLFIYAIKTLETPLSLGFFILSFAFVAVATLLYFSILSFIATLTFWIHRNETFNVLIFNISQLSRYPRQIYTNTVGRVLTFGLPVALLASIPAEVALVHKDGYLPLYFVAISIIFYILGRYFWKLGLRAYSSAN